jgi:hypothetical protein
MLENILSPTLGNHPPQNKDQTDPLLEELHFDSFDTPVEI